MWRRSSCANAAITFAIASPDGVVVSTPRSSATRAQRRRRARSSSFARSAAVPVDQPAGRVEVPGQQLPSPTSDSRLHLKRVPPVGAILRLDLVPPARAVAAIEPFGDDALEAAVAHRTP